MLKHSTVLPLKSFSGGHACVFTSSLPPSFLNLGNMYFSQFNYSRMSANPLTIHAVTSSVSSEFARHSDEPISILEITFLFLFFSFLSNWFIFEHLLIVRDNS